MARIERLFLYRNPARNIDYIIADNPDLEINEASGEWAGKGRLVRFCTETWDAIRPELPWLRSGEGPREIELSIKFKETEREE